MLKVRKELLAIKQKAIDATDKLNSDEGVVYLKQQVMLYMKEALTLDSMLTAHRGIFSDMCGEEALNQEDSNYYRTIVKE